MTERDLAAVEGPVRFIATTFVLINLTVDPLVMATNRRLRSA